jgi:hypothetical protein
MLDPLAAVAAGAHLLHRQHDAPRPAVVDPRLRHVNGGVQAALPGHGWAGAVVGESVASNSSSDLRGSGQRDSRKMPGMPNGRGRPKRSKLETLEIRARIVDLARQGHSQRAIAAEIGFESANAVAQHLAAYRATLPLSTELAEEWRNTKLERADARFRRLGPKSLGKQDEHGNWIEEPDYQALAALQREEDAIARLLGAELQRGVQINLVSAEQMAEMVFGAKAAIDVDGEELDQDQALGLGSE